MTVILRLFARIAAGPSAAALFTPARRLATREDVVAARRARWAVRS